jgi:ABC-2 type transport system ATP-binding protein
MTILTIDNLTKTYENGHRALDGLTLSVKKGTITGFLGLNGAGKTTTIRILAGLTSKDSGTITLFGKELSAHEAEHKRLMGFVLDEPLYFDWMSPAEYLHFVGTMYGVPPQDIHTRCDELLAFFDLREKQNDPIAELSTGMKKKISLAAAIIHKPELVVLDEPLEGIDPVAARAIKNTLKMMAQNGTSIFITSHVLDTVEKLCDEIAIIHRGRVLVQCPTAEVHTKVMASLDSTIRPSLEELFVDLVADKTPKKPLSWL